MKNNKIPFIVYLIIPLGIFMIYDFIDGTIKVLTSGSVLNVLLFIGLIVFIVKLLNKSL